MIHDGTNTTLTPSMVNNTTIITACHIWKDSENLHGENRMNFVPSSRLWQQNYYLYPLSNMHMVAMISYNTLQGFWVKRPGGGKRGKRARKNRA